MVSFVNYGSCVFFIQAQRPRINSLTATLVNLPYSTRAALSLFVVPVEQATPILIIEFRDERRSGFNVAQMTVRVSLHTSQQTSRKGLVHLDNAMVQNLNYQTSDVIIETVVWMMRSHRARTGTACEGHVSV